MPGLTSHFVRIAREGTTIDGRHITGTQIEEMARNYRPEEYGARIWLEHIRGLLPDGVFPALGDVVALSTEKDEEGKRMLLAKLAPTDRLLEINKSRQKVYTSIEMDPSFAGSGEAYLVGLAVTDSPASLGTQALTFTRQHSPELKDKLPNNTYSSPLEVSSTDFKVNVQPVEETQTDPPGVLRKVRELLSRSGKRGDARFADMEAGILELANTVETLRETVNTFTTSLPDTSPAATDPEILSHKIDTLMEKLANAPDPSRFPRPPATGGTGVELTDC